MSFSSAGRGSSSIRFWIRLRTLFSWPAVVWMAYQRYSIALPRQRGDAVYQDLLQHPVEQADRDAEHQRHDDDHAGRLHQLRLGRPSDLLHLGHDRVEELPDLRDLAGPARRRLLDCVHAYFDSLCAL